MSRSGRLFLLMDAMRAKRVPVTAAQLAQQLGVSERTIYRDIQTLAELGAPLQGEAGIGYVLRRGAFLPPLMFGADELEALVLGARWVRRQGDAGLAQAASNALAKIAAASPRDLRDSMAETSLWVPLGRPADGTRRRPLRAARARVFRTNRSSRSPIRRHGSATSRGVPFAWLCRRQAPDGRWCELRAITDFRIAACRRGA